jgi:hypothetical protein
VSAGLADFDASYTHNIDPGWAIEMCSPEPELSDLEAFSTEPLPKGQGKCVSTTSDYPDWVPCDDSYFLSGGIIAVAPQPVSQGNAYEDATVLVIPNTWGYHIEFGDVRDLQSLRHGMGVCAMLGDDGGAVFWCLRQGQPSEYLAGTYVTRISHCMRSLFFPRWCLLSSRSAG